MRRECRECFPRHWLQRKQLVSDPGMRHGTCVMYVPWCMSGLLTRGGGENVPSIPGACATRNFTYLVKGPYPDGSSTAHWPLVVGRRRTQFGGQPSRRYPYMGWWRTYLENICDTFVLFSLSPLSYVIFMYWLPARWAHGFSGDHQQNVMLFILLSEFRELTLCLLFINIVVILWEIKLLLLYLWCILV